MPASPALIYTTNGTSLITWDPATGAFTSLVDFGTLVLGVPTPVRINDIAFINGDLYGFGGPTGRGLYLIDPTTGFCGVPSEYAIPGEVTGFSRGLGAFPILNSSASGEFFTLDTRNPNLTVKPTLVVDRIARAGDTAPLGNAYGDTVVFNAAIWTLAEIALPGGTSRFELQAYDVDTGVMQHRLRLPTNSLLTEQGIDPRQLGGLAIGPDGNLYVAGGANLANDLGMYRVDLYLDPAVAGAVLYREGTYLGLGPIRGAASPLDDQIYWLIGGHNGDQLTATNRDGNRDPFANEPFYRNLYTGKSAKMFGHGGNDTLTGSAWADSIYGDWGADSLSGLEGNDRIFGDTWNDTILGGAGLDELQGGDDNDSLSGGADSDVLMGGEGHDSLDGGDGSDILQDVGLGNDLFLGGAGNDVILAEDGNDLAYGEAGADNVAGGGGADYLHGGTENDTLGGDAGNDTLLGAEGDDELSGGQDNDQILGGAGNDRGFGGTGNDLLRGEAGTDRLSGQGGNDTLVGGPGADTLTGGTGADVFRFELQIDYYIAPVPFTPPPPTRFTPDVIADFVAAEADRIDLGALFDSFPAPNLSAAQLRAQGWLRVTQSGPDALVQVDSNGTLGGTSFLTVAVVQNTLATALTDAVFLV